MGLFNSMLGKKDPVIPSVSIEHSQEVYQRLVKSHLDVSIKLCLSREEAKRLLIELNDRANEQLLLIQKYINLQKACNCIAGSKAMNKIVGK